EPLFSVKRKKQLKLDENASSLLSSLSKPHQHPNAKNLFWSWLTVGRSYFACAAMAR
ncbi:Hypothetical protein, putative, partial [Bodo saltans]